MFFKFVIFMCLYNNYQGSSLMIFWYFSHVSFYEQLLLSGYVSICYMYQNLVSMHGNLWNYWYIWNSIFEFKKCLLFNSYTFECLYSFLKYIVLYVLRYHLQIMFWWCVCIHYFIVTDFDTSNTLKCLYAYCVCMFTVCNVTTRL